MFPFQTIIISLLLFIGYLIIRNISSNNTERNGNSMRRQMALNEAKIYLAPYNDIWKNLRLSNKYCTLRLGYDGQTITAYDIGRNRSFKVVRSRVHAYSDLWDMFCMSFSHQTTFDELVKLCEKFQVSIDINGEQKDLYNKDEKLKPDKPEIDVVKTEGVSINKKEKIDVNNSSEVELTALPGVSIVMAKKLIKKREEIGGFKSVNDVCLFLHLKPHMQKQLEQLICVKKMKGSVNLQRYNERRIDL